MSSSLTNEEHQTASRYCRDHLDGPWKEASSSDIVVTKLSGGMSNLLYRCALRNTKTTTNHIADHTPGQVLLRIYGRAQGNLDAQLEIIHMLAQDNLGPRLFKTFEGGRFEEFLPSDALTWKQMTDRSISRVIANKIAAIHKIHVQKLDKNSNWLIGRYNHYNKFIESTRDKALEFDDNTAQSTRTIAYQMMAIDFQPEIEFLSQLFAASREPLVLSHNDMHHNNIIVLDDTNQSIEQRVVPIDFEYSSYNYRLFDLGNHLSEWCFDLARDVYPFFEARLEWFPSEARQREFIEQYLKNFSLEKSSQLFPYDHDDENQLVEILLKEMRPFVLASNLLWSIWAVKGARTSKINFGYWEMAKFKWDLYCTKKDEFYHNHRPNQCYGDHMMRLGAKM